MRHGTPLPVPALPRPKPGHEWHEHTRLIRADSCPFVASLLCYHPAPGTSSMTDPEIEDRLALWDASPAAAKPSAEQLCGGRTDLLERVRRAIAERRPTMVASANEPEAGTATIASTPGAAPHPQDAAAAAAAASPVSRNAFSVPGYPIVRKLGEGGQAVVYEAVQTSTGRRVALKVLQGGQLASENQQRRLEREARVLAELRHPNIVSIIDRGTTP